VTPHKKPIPTNLSIEMQQQLLFHPETNPTGHVPFENAQAFPFDVDASTPSRVNAWWLAEASWLAYWHDGDAAARVFRDRAGMNCEVASVDGAEVCFASSPRFALVAFRGTQAGDWSDIFDDACYRAVPWDVGHVHRGFAHRLNTLDAPLRRFLEKLDAGTRVWFTGHSLGAAAATLAAYRFRGVAGGLYTFGSPLVGSEGFSAQIGQTFKGRSVRYVNDHDVVTRVPPPPFAFPHGEYTHVAAERFIDASGTISNQPRGVLPFVRDIFGRPNAVLDILDIHMHQMRGLLTLRRTPTLPDSLSDHTPLYYALHTWNDFAAV
jgi:triacylglycerol lipase